ncbi:hypothetical protein ACFSDD_06940 [Salipiger marinus]|uniref:hypothetical protein n=1 Tax=Salipiger marinus TaxID=555512 RepID=UPI001E343A81|nr:hypothetical protein [Salipiger manganoxidans]MCD1620305.1 hypothetical protein [Salipiger manganoxidans]
MKRTIEVDLDVFSEIWRRREPNEIAENDVLRRVFGLSGDMGPDMRVSTLCHAVKKDERSRATEEALTSNCELEQVFNVTRALVGRVRWVDDVELALELLGGVASLHQIYGKVEELRRQGGRSLPPTLQATIRRTIEDHSSDSDNFRGVDLFVKHSRGEWGLRRRREA